MNLVGNHTLPMRMKKTMKDKTYQVGQILYVIPTGKTAVIPIQIVEEIVKRSLSGEEIAYKVSYGKDGKSAMLAEIDGEVFDSAENVRNVLVTRSTEAIHGMVMNAKKNSESWYEGGFEKVDEDELTVTKVPVKNSVKNGVKKKQKSESPKPKSNGSPTVRLPDGSIVQVSGIPEPSIPQ